MKIAPDKQELLYRPQKNAFLCKITYLKQRVLVGTDKAVA